LHIEFLDKRKDVSNSKLDSKSTGEYEVCKIRTADPKFFTNILIAPSPHHFVILCSELLTTIDRPELFIKFFESTPSHDYTVSRIDRLTAHVRQRFFLFFMSHSTLPATPDLWPLEDKHFISLSSLSDRLRVLAILYLAYFADTAEERIMRMVGATFVEGREPWKLWERALRRQWLLPNQAPTETSDWTMVEKDDLGSIRLA
jgi:hypothetical protein